MKLSDYFGVNFEYAESKELLLKIKALTIAESLTGAEIDVLYSVYNSGIIESGDLPSKLGRTSLVEKGVIVQTCSNLIDYGYSVSYPLGFRVIKARSILSKES